MIIIRENLANTLFVESGSETKNVWWITMKFYVGNSIPNLILKISTHRKGNYFTIVVE